MPKKPTAVKDVVPHPKGVVTIKVTYPDGSKKVFILENRVVAQGRDYMMRNTIGLNTVNIAYVAFSNSTATVGDNETS